jgi:DMSO/TMAO reductase YedYZ molybdopterin-dependent catalytic subunit
VALWGKSLAEEFFVASITRHWENQKMVELAVAGQGISQAELAQASRNRGMPLEALRYDLTPSGLHYLLVHFDVPVVDPDTWRLRVFGAVHQDLELSLGDILQRPAVTIAVTMECAGNGRARLVPRPMTQPWLHEAVSTASWTGTPLSGVLEEAGIGFDAVEFVFTGADHGIEGDVELDYARSLSMSEVMRPEVLLAYEMNGRPLEPQHGFPVRLLVPGWYGMTSVKWLMSIEAVTRPFEGFHQAVAYRYQASEDDPGQAVTRIRPRALMIPPGFPDFPDRHRYLERGTVTLVGRAWSGMAPIRQVQVGVDGGWFDAELEGSPGYWAWQRWSYVWDATPGRHVVSCRATDEEGGAQPLEQPWNFQGMGNNMVQVVEVTVR